MEEKEILAEIEKMQALEKQIEAERTAETEKVNKMSKEERIEYLKQKEQRAAEFAASLGMNQKQVVSNGKKGV